MSPLFRALGAQIEYPWLALVPGFLLFALYRQAHRRSALWVGLAWLGYCLYEFGMKRRLLCSGECNIRVDLLLIYPALLVGSVVAVARSLTALRSRRGGPP
jgi:hypothetical protein